MLTEEPYSQPIRSTSRRTVYGALFVLLFILSNAILGLVGGIAGFVLLSNSTSPLIVNLRDRLGIDQDGEVGIPVRQNIRVEESSAVIDATARVTPAVVAISTEGQAYDFFGRPYSQSGSGSGFIITSDGLIVTNRHVVVGGNQTTYKVILNDGRNFDAKVQALDTVNDFAVLKIDARDLPTVEIGSSDALQLGQYVIAVGNALGEFRNSITLGVVSAKNRTLEASSAGSSEKLTDLIQTDAAINPGNSGGPLVNLLGQVVGINTAIASTSGGSDGIGFAISIDSLKTVIDGVRKTGTIIRPYLGVRAFGINKTIQRLNNLSVDYGAMVTSGQIGALSVIPGSPADKAGIKEGDIILEVNGERVDESTTLPTRIQKYAIGDEVTLKILREGNEQSVKVKLEQAPSS